MGALPPTLDPHALLHSSKECIQNTALVLVPKRTGAATSMCLNIYAPEQQHITSRASTAQGTNRPAHRGPPVYAAIPKARAGYNQTFHPAMSKHEGQETIIYHAATCTKLDLPKIRPREATPYRPYPQELQTTHRTQTHCCCRHVCY